MIRIRSFVRSFAVLRRFRPASRVRSVRTVACVLAACAALLACTPTYDWRTIMNNDDGYEVTLPAKPRSDERAIEIAGQTMQMKMQTAEAGDAVFAVGTVVLPNADPATQRAALDFLQQGLAHNLNAAPVVRPVEIDIAAGGKLDGAEINVRGPGGSEKQSDTRSMHARFVAKGTHVYQVAIVSATPPPDDQADQFFSSFKLY
jgi:hypothetical protein